MKLPLITSPLSKSRAIIAPLPPPAPAPLARPAVALPLTDEQEPDQKELAALETSVSLTSALRKFKQWLVFCPNREAEPEAVVNEMKSFLLSFPESDRKQKLTFSGWMELLREGINAGFIANPFSD